MSNMAEVHSTAPPYDPYGQQQQSYTSNTPSHDMMKQEPNYYNGAQQGQQTNYPQHQQQQQAPPLQHQPSVQGQQSQYKTSSPLGNLQEHGAPVDCPSCGTRGMTRTEAQSGNTTHAWAAGICAVFCLGCIPYLVASLKDVTHKCGHCGVVLAKWHRSGRTEVMAYA